MRKRNSRTGRPRTRSARWRTQPSSSTSSAARPPGRPRPCELDQRRRRLVRDHDQALLRVDLPQPFRRDRGEFGEPALGLPPPRGLRANLAPATGRDDAEGDRQDHEQRQELVEQPAPFARRPRGEQSADVDHGRERRGPARQHQEGDDVAQSDGANGPPRRTRCPVVPVSKLRHEPADPERVSDKRHSAAPGLRNPLCHAPGAEGRAEAGFTGHWPL